MKYLMRVSKICVTPGKSPFYQFEVEADGKIHALHKGQLLLSTLPREIKSNCIRKSIDIVRILPDSFGNKNTSEKLWEG